MRITTHSAAGTTGTNGTPATGSASSSTSTSSASSGTSGVSLGGTDFLTLMLAQLQNQDPTSPVDSNTFLTQLAELSEVQGINSLNTSFSTLSNSLGSSAASSLLGHTVLVSSSSVNVTTPGTAVTGAVAVPQTTTGVTVNVLNSAGTVVKQINLGAQSTGVADFTWDGTEADGSAAPAGAYSLSASVVGVASSTKVNTYVNGTVESVTMASGSTGMMLNVPTVGSVPYSAVEQISN
jgi:flagellar basal-body rod modification protein FlgD